QVRTGVPPGALRGGMAPRLPRGRRRGDHDRLRAGRDGRAGGGSPSLVPDRSPRVRELAERRGHGPDTLALAGIRAVSADRCYLCGTEGTVVLQGLRDRLTGVPGAWSARRCPACGLQWLDPRPVEED